MTFGEKIRKSILIDPLGAEGAEGTDASLRSAAEKSAVDKDAKSFPWPLTHADSTTREQLILLAQKVFFSPVPTRMVLLAGCGRGVGCTWMTVQLGGILAAHRKGSVCIIDASLRNPSLHELFDAKPSPGLSDLALNSARIEDAVRRLPGVDAAIIPAGTPVSDPAALLGSEKLKARILDLRAKFDYILIDCAPANEYPDAAMLAGICDGILLVAAAGQTRKQVAQFCKNQIESNSGKVLGAVLNRRAFPIPAGLYSKLA